MPVDLYNLGVSELLAAQQQLSTTGHNIANVDFEVFGQDYFNGLIILSNLSGKL